MCRRDVLRGLNKVGFALDTRNDEQCTPEHINKMFAAGYFENFANQRNQRNEYLAAGAEQASSLQIGPFTSTSPPDTRAYTPFIYHVLGGDAVLLWVIKYT